MELKWNPEGQCWSGQGDDLPSHEAVSVSIASPVQSTVDDPDVTGQTLLLVLELVVDDVLPHCKLHSVHSDQSDHAKTKIEKCQNFIKSKFILSELILFKV